MVQHPVFHKYRREFLHEVTGFSLDYLCRIATGRAPLTRSFIERVCFALNAPGWELFLPYSAEEKGIETKKTKERG